MEFFSNSAARRSWSFAAATRSAGTPCCATAARWRDGAFERLGILPATKDTWRRRCRPGAADRARSPRRVPCPEVRGRRARSGGCRARPEHIERGEVATVEAGRADRDHRHAVRLIGAHAEGGGVRRVEPHRGPLGSFLGRIPPKSCFTSSRVAFGSTSPAITRMALFGASHVSWNCSALPPWWR